MNQSVPVAQAGQNEKASNHGWPAAVFTGLVLGAALFAFSPRPQPVFPATQVYPDRVLVNGLAEDGKRIVAVGEQGHILIVKSVGPAATNYLFLGRVTIVLYWFLEVSFLSVLRFAYRHFRYTRVRRHARTDDASPHLRAFLECLPPPLAGTL